MMSAQVFKSWILAFRPKTLSAAIVPVVVATALVWARGDSILWWVSGLALLGALLIQIGTNLVNDAIDFKKGADTNERLGPRRVTASGVFSAKAVLWASAVVFALAVASGIPLVIHGGWPIVVIGVVSVLLGYAYTAGPFPLAYLGLGDLFVIVFFGLVAVGGTVYLHTLSYYWDVVIAGLQVGFLSTVLLAINNLRDVEQDKKVGKKTLAVRFGVTFSRLEILLLLVFSFGLGAYWVTKGWYLTGLLPLTLLPFAWRLVREVARTAPSPEYNRFLAQAASLQILFGFQIALGLYLEHLVQ